MAIAKVEEEESLKEIMMKFDGAFNALGHGNESSNRHENKIEDDSALVW